MRSSAIRPFDLPSCRSRFGVLINTFLLLHSAGELAPRFTPGIVVFFQIGRANRALRRRPAADQREEGDLAVVERRTRPLPAADRRGATQRTSAAADESAESDMVVLTTDEMCDSATRDIRGTSSVAEDGLFAALEYFEVLEFESPTLGRYVRRPGATPGNVRSRSRSGAIEGAFIFMSSFIESTRRLRYGSGTDLPVIVSICLPSSRKHRSQSRSCSSLGRVGGAEGSDPAMATCVAVAC